MAFRAGMAGKWKRMMVGGMALVVLSSCNGDGDSAAPTSASTPTSGGPAPSTTLRPVDTSFTGQSNTQFCAMAKTYNDRSTSADRATTPDQLRTEVVESRAAIEQVATAAPAEIKGDAQALANAIGVLFTELEKVNFDRTKVSLAAFTPLQTPEFAQSTLRFQAYMRNVCGIS